MRKWLNAEIALGFLVATVLWTAVLGWQAAHAPTEREKQACYEAAQKSDHKNEECKTLWERTANDPVALFTLVLAFSTVGLWLATIGLFRAGERQIAVAAKSAEAANLSAKAAVNVDMPFVLLERIDVGVSGGFSEERVISGLPPMRSKVKFHVRNFGRTPAFVSAVCIEWEVAKSLPPVPIYRRIAPQDVVIEAGEDSGFATSNEEVTFTPEQIQAAAATDAKFWTYGFIAFRDFLGREHRTGFCAAWFNVGAGPYSLSVCRLPGYTYENQPQSEVG